uniref:Uncharacterized protein n=1 Tax=Nelumbo nucifera TaxID=4432 RepID=A0A822XI98_NELNU|nr:TPA_asm: hypothetical protein HUJ06_020232 [Nelumbo nucifera]DAD18771.1 TPA_asm: hypothetical protein HUJ06_020234 [Nelumbo nucifera]
MYCSFLSSKKVCIKFHVSKDY